MTDEKKFDGVLSNLHDNVKVKPRVDQWIMDQIMEKRDEILAAFRKEAGCEPSEAILVLERVVTYGDDGLPHEGIKLELRRQRPSDFPEE